MKGKDLFHYVFVLLLFSAFTPGLFSQTSPENLKVLPPVCLSETEQQIYRMINAYREEKGLNPVPLSASLTYVAQSHVRDLADNGHITSRCNLHSWSGHGPWTGCCYTEDHKQAACMWNKPRELTDYDSEGYEIAFWTNAELDPAAFADRALKAWKHSPDHNEVLVNIRQWKDKEWNAIGIGYYKGYAAVWFGTLPDPEGEVRRCSE